MNLHQSLSLALDPSLLLRARGLVPDPWQRELLLAPERQLLLNCSRQSGKSTVISALDLVTRSGTSDGRNLLAVGKYRLTALSVSDHYDERKGEQAMSSTDTRTVFPLELAAARDEALRNAMTGNRDPETMRQACDEQDRLCEELRQKNGDLNVAVELVREVRDDA